MEIQAAQAQLDLQLREDDIRRLKSAVEKKDAVIDRMKQKLGARKGKIGQLKIQLESELEAQSNSTFLDPNRPSV